MRWFGYILSYLIHRLRSNGAMRIHSPKVYGFYREIVLGKGRGYENTVSPVDEALFERIRPFKAEVGKVYDAGPIARTPSFHTRGFLWSRKAAGMLFRLARQMQASVVFDISLAAQPTAIALAMGWPGSQVHVLNPDHRGDGRQNALAESVGLLNLHLHVGITEKLLVGLMHTEGRPDIVVLHAELGFGYLVELAQLIIPRLQQQAICIVVGMHGSKDTREAWAMIQCMPEVSTTLDFFHLGVVFVSEEMSRQHFSLRG